jgi:hypothetical protein
MAGRLLASPPCYVSRLCRQCRSEERLQKQRAPLAAMSGRGGGRYGGRGGGGGRYGAGRATNPLHTGGRGGYGRGRGRGGAPGGGSGGGDDAQRSRDEAEAAACALEERLGFELHTDGEPRLGFLMNMSQARALEPLAHARRQPGCRP